MRALKAIGNAALALAAVLGVLSGLVWGATQLGWIQPLVVISGSMEPGIKTGDLVVAARTPVAELEVGQVVSLYSEVTRRLITHRIVEIERNGHDTAVVRMQGDANESGDAEAYHVQGTVWEPRWQVGGGGYAVAAITKRSVAVPLAVTLLALIGLTQLPSERRRDDEAEAPPAPARPRGRHVLQGS